MFATDIYQERRRRLVKKLKSGMVLLPGNVDSPYNARDNCYPFRQDSSFLYFCGLDQPGLTLLLDIDGGREILFGKEQSTQDVIWSGSQPTLHDQAGRAGIGTVMADNALEREVRKLLSAGRTIHCLPSCRVENLLLRAELLNQPLSAAKELFSEPLIRAVVELRSVKAPEEIRELDAAADLGGELHKAAMSMAVPGVYEWQVAGELSAVAARAGRQLAFPPIVTTRGEVLHNHQRCNQLRSGDLLLVDCGIESSLHYASDHTRTFPVGGSFTSRQRDLYLAVLACMDHARTLIRPGITYLEVHRAVCLTLVTALQGLGLMRGDAEEAVAAGAHALFMPHGLGHMLGLDVHDMEDLGEEYVGYDDKIQRSNQFGTSALRLGRELREGYVLTVEPGIYFIPALIEQWKSAARHANFINYTKLSGYMDFGGLRLEDDLLVTAGGNRLLGSKPIPIKIDELQSRMDISHGNR
ncbi:MAG: aminopeptidase P family protein [Desulfuromonadales bacterium]